MGLLEYLRNAAKSETTVYTTFLQQYNNRDNSLHIFHEGKEDPSFYDNFIQKKLKKAQKVFYYQARNKDFVYDNYRKINWASYSKKRILFLVDKDYSDILKIQYPIDDNIFVTKYYSIENYLVNKGIFSRSLRELIGLDSDASNSAISKQFKIGLNSFYDSSLILSAYILYHKQNKTPIVLKDITISDIFKIDDLFNVTRKRGLLATLDKKTGATTVNAFREIKVIMNELQKINEPKNYTRGKFELGYMIACINKCPDIINSGKQKGQKKFKSCVQLSMTNAIPILAPRLTRHKDFKIFINKVLA